MSSVSAAVAGTAYDDRTAKARIRDAAIECFARDGVAGTTARKVATAAGVSPALVMHHYGSMEGLRTACDEYVAATIRTLKHEAMEEGPQLDVLGALRDIDSGPVAGYLAAVLGEDSPAVARLVDELVADAEGYLDHGVESGMMLPSADPRGRAAVVLIWSLGALVLHRHVHRLLGVDLTDPEVARDPAFAAYAGPAYEVLCNGVFTSEFAAHVEAAMGAADASRRTTSTPSIDTGSDPNQQSKEG